MKAELPMSRRCCDQASNVDLRSRSEVDAVGIDDDDAPRCCESAEYFGYAAAGHAVQGERRGRRLFEMRVFAGFNIEAVPVDDDTITVLSDICARRRDRDDLSVTCGEVTALGVRQRWVSRSPWPLELQPTPGQGIFELRPMVARTPNVTLHRFRRGAIRRPHPRRTSKVHFQRRNYPLTDHPLTG